MVVNFDFLTLLPKKKHQKTKTKNICNFKTVNSEIIISLVLWLICISRISLEKTGS